jgi:hypothetical protein
MKEQPSRGPQALFVASRGARLLLVAAVVVALIVGGGAAIAAGSHPQTGTVSGVVVYGPMLPVDPGAPVSWPPEQAVVSVFKPGDTTPLLTMRTGADGRFAIHLAPGRYRLSAQPAGVSILPICHDVIVNITAGGARHVRLWLDTGLRFPPAAGVRPADEPAGVTLYYHQGLVGTTRRGPITPVAQPGQPNDAPCAATLRVYRLDGTLVATVHSRAKSGFWVDLPAGRYVVDPRSDAAAFDHAAPFSIRIPRGAWRSVTIMFDTGIR